MCAKFQTTFMVLRGKKVLARKFASMVTDPQRTWGGVQWKGDNLRAKCSPLCHQPRSEPHTSLAFRLTDTMLLLCFPSTVSMYASSMKIQVWLKAGLDIILMWFCYKWMFVFNFLNFFLNHFSIHSLVKKVNLYKNFSKKILF